MPYLKWSEKTITDFSDKSLSSLYNEGYLFGRTGRGEMYQTRSLRIDLSKFELSSENRRILRKTENVVVEKQSLPDPNYHWSIGKLGKDFYTKKFGDGTFSANKIKELMTDKEKSNFNTLFTYSTVIPSDSTTVILNDLPAVIPSEFAAANDHTIVIPNPVRTGEESLSELSFAREFASERTAVREEYSLNNKTGIPPVVGITNKKIGYCIALETNEFIHYCYPFYQLENASLELPTNLGLGMMLKAIVWTKEHGKKYIYLGSFSRPTDAYKLKFEGLEWWDGKEWNTNTETLKNV